MEKRTITVKEYQHSQERIEISFKYLTLSGDTFTHLMLTLEEKEPELYQKIRAEFEEAMDRYYGTKIKVT